MTHGLYILGAGGHAKVVVALAEALGFTICGIYDDRPLPLPNVLGHPVTGPMAAVPDHPDTHAVIAIGNNAVRRTVAARFQSVTWATLVHPTAWVAPSSLLGEGTVVMAGAVIQPDATVGRHVIINTAASVDHDCDLQNYVHVAPGTRLAGNVSLGEGAFLGVGSVCIPGIQVGAWTTVGAGAAVVKPLPANVTAVGVPAVVRTQLPSS